MRPLLFRPLAALLATLLLTPALPAQETRLSNVSVRTAAGGADILITGFTISPGPDKTILVRAVGPTLGIFGVPGTLADPKLELYNSSAVKIGENDNFNASDAPTFASVGAFALGANSKDAAIVTTLAPGSYTAQVTGVGGASGVALVEVYEVTGGATRLINLSTRAQVGTGSNILIPGITVAPGTGTRRLLLRAVGPTLSIFGVPGTLADPKLELYSGSAKIAENDNWSTPVGTGSADAATLAAAFTTGGAFALPAGSKDAALLVNLTAGSYTLQVSGVGGTTGAALVEVYDITPSAPPVITTAPVGVVVSAGQRVLFTVVATGAPAPTYQWQKNGVNLPGATGASLTLSSAQAADAGSYTVVLTNTAGTATSSAALLTVNFAAAITVQPIGQVAVAGQPVTLSVVATGSPAPAYQWQKDGVNLPGATGASLVLASAQPADAGRYTVVVTNALGTATSTPAALTVNVTPAITAQPGSQTPILGRVVTLSVSATGTPAPTYQWQRNGAAITGATGATLTLNNVQPADGGDYTVIITNAAGSVTSAIATLTPIESPTITIAATKATSDESGTNPGEFTFTRTGLTLSPLTVNYGVGGSAVNGVDYPALVGFLTFPAGVSSVKLPLSPNPDVQNEGLDTVVLTLTAGSDYTVGAPASATVTIADSPATLYIASVRPTGTASGGSTASGSASILLSSSGTLASVNVSFSNLSSAQVTAHLTIGATEDYVFNLPQGQVTGVRWNFTPTGPYSSAALLDALKSGNIAVRIDTAKYPDGEIKGAFISGAGSQVFIAPADAPAVSLTNITATDAARFLTQTTFGPTKTEIDSLTGGSIDKWITDQMALPLTSHRTAIVDDRTTFGGSGSFTNWNAIHLPNRQSAWFKVSLTAPDQLRQRVAYALSQILVVSDVALGDDSDSEPLAYYYDQLGNGAFGNFRALLETVTLSPMMGRYLSSLRNSKADPVTGQTPDENYAREVMQLFTIGLVQLQPDGTLALGADGLPIPTYNQKTITEMAKVFTGWGYPSTNPTQFRTATKNSFTPMQVFASNHDDTIKDISPVSPTPIAANQGGVKDLQLALDALFTHANTAPFISKLLIQRLVTSNPSPGYVYRVARKFENNGSGTRGDLGAVVRAILTDNEARSPSVASNAAYGKLKEPLLRLTGLMRSFGASSTSGRFLGYRYAVDGVPITGATPLPATQAQITTISSATQIYSAIGSIAQAALRSPSVFNFYHPDYVLPGPLAAAGLVAPEFEITDDNFAINVPNFLRGFVTAVIPTSAGAPTTAAPYVVTLNTTYEQTLVATPPALLDHLNRVLCAGSLSDATRTRVTAALTALPATTSPVDRVNTAILLVLTSQSAAIQK